MGLLVGLRLHDLKAAGTFIEMMYGDKSRLGRLAAFIGWTLRQSLATIPRALASVRFAKSVSRTPIWLAAGNPLANHPWSKVPDTTLPASVDTIVIGAGFTGAGLAYHWARAATTDSLAVLEMDDPASGASGRNEGLVVMGRYFAMVRDTVAPYLAQVRPDLTPDQCRRLADQFAARYAHSAYKNGDMIEATILAEGFACDYSRRGWIQDRGPKAREALRESVEAGQRTGFDDWTSMTPEQVLELGGMEVDGDAGFSRRAAAFHPAKWVWALLAKALEQPHIHLFSRTRVLRVEDQGDYYRVDTARGAIKARHVVNATESYTAALHPQYGEFIFPRQTQAAFGTGGPPQMAEGVGLSGGYGFFGRHGKGVMVGSDATRVKEAGRNKPSRFITKFLLGELNRYFGRSQLTITHEWSGTPGFTSDEYPVVGLLDKKRMYIIGGMCGSGSAVSFNGARHIVQQILGLDGPDDYPAAYFAPSRILDPAKHPWPAVEDAG